MMNNKKMLFLAICLHFEQKENDCHVRSTCSVFFNVNVMQILNIKLKLKVIKN